ncbi:unnamed protein product [Closterium sp. NIES-65]|nr:unnamed protein product [Closterium sp. NIES-65]
MLKDKRAAFLRQQERVQARTVVDHAAATAARRQAAPSPARAPRRAPLSRGKLRGAERASRWGFQGLQAENWLADAGKYEAVLRVRQLPLGQKIKKVIDLLFRERQGLTAEQVEAVTMVGRHHQPRAAGQPACQPQACRLPLLRCGALPVVSSIPPPLCPSDLPPTPSMLPPSHPPRLSLALSPPLNRHGNAYTSRRSTSWRSGRPAEADPRAQGRHPHGDVRDSYSAVAQHVQELRAMGQAWVLFNADSGDEVLFPNDPRIAIKVDPDIRALFRRIDLPRDLTDLEKELQRCGQNPAMPAVRRLQALEGAMTAQHAVPAVPAGLAMGLVAMVRGAVVEVVGGGSREVGGMRHGRSAV